MVSRFATPWEENKKVALVSKGAAEVLKYTNPSDALRTHVDVEDKGVAKCDTLGGTQEMTVIN